MISLLQTLCKPLFGTFEKEEFKKFLRMGAIFSCIIGSYWTMRVLKNALFCDIVGAAYLPWAKTVSVISLTPLIMLYSKALDVLPQLVVKLPRIKMFYILSSLYVLFTIIFSIIFITPIGLASPIDVCLRDGATFYITQILAFIWYVFVESYGSLIIALFWAIAANITLPDSAKKGFSLIVAIGQIGGIFGPYFLTRLPRLFGFSTSAISVFSCIFFIIASMILLKNFFKKTPKHLLIPYRGTNEAELEKKQKPGFLEGLNLLVHHGYLLGIFAVLSAFEILVTVFDFHFQNVAAMHHKGIALAEFQGLYGALVNALTLVCFLFGISGITRYLGIGASLISVPIIFGFAVFGFSTFDSLIFLFTLMVSSKAINYALNKPALKQLYIPTTQTVRFKTQTWNETFGSRVSKEAGSIFNMFLIPLQRSFGDIAGRAQHIALTSYFGFFLVAIWFFIALYLGKTYKKAVDNKKVVC